MSNEAFPFAIIAMECHLDFFIGRGGRVCLSGVNMVWKKIVKNKTEYRNEYECPPESHRAHRFIIAGRRGYTLPFLINRDIMQMNL